MFHALDAHAGHFVRGVLHKDGPVHALPSLIQPQGVYDLEEAAALQARKALPLTFVSNRMSGANQDPLTSGLFNANYGRPAHLIPVPGHPDMFVRFRNATGHWMELLDVTGPLQAPKVIPKPNNPSVANTSSSYQHTHGFFDTDGTFLVFHGWANDHKIARYAIDPFGPSCTHIATYDIDWTGHPNGAAFDIDGVTYDEPFFFDLGDGFYLVGSSYNRVDFVLLEWDEASASFKYRHWARPNLLRTSNNHNWDRLYQFDYWGRSEDTGRDAWLYQPYVFRFNNATTGTGFGAGWMVLNRGAKTISFSPAINSTAAPPIRARLFGLEGMTFAFLRTHNTGSAPVLAVDIGQRTTGDTAYSWRLRATPFADLDSHGPHGAYNADLVKINENVLLIVGAFQSDTSNTAYNLGECRLFARLYARQPGGTAWSEGPIQEIPSPWFAAPYHTSYQAYFRRLDLYGGSADNVVILKANIFWDTRINGSGWQNHCWALQAVQETDGTWRLLVPRDPFTDLGAWDHYQYAAEYLNQVVPLSDGFLDLTYNRGFTLREDP